jgi:two-component system, OmpR family, alkaline phosphatase synthesis response regulator PhoP
MKKMVVLVVEDEEDISELIRFNLEKAGFEVLQATTGPRAVEIFKEKLPNLVLLDLMIPELNGIEVCKKIQSMDSSSEVPIIMVTAKGGEEDIVAGLEAGASDYVTKPFSPNVLLARVKAALRLYHQSQTTQSHIVEIPEHNIVIDSLKRQFLIEGGEKELTFSEFELIWTLASHPGLVFTRSQLVDLIRGEQHAITDRSIDVHIVGLRKKLQNCSYLIESVRGVGYKMKEVN